MTQGTRFNSIPLLTFCIKMILICSCSGPIEYMGYNPYKPGEKPIFTKEQILLGEDSKLRNAYDVKYYDLKLKINPKLKTLEGKLEMYADALTSIDTIQVDLHPNFNINRLYNKKTNKDLIYEREERAIRINANYNQEDKFILCIEYTGQPIIAKKPPWEGGFVWKNDKKGYPWIGVACEAEGANIWWPLKDQTSDEPDSMRLHYEVPEGLVAVGNGQLESTEKKEKTMIYNWFISYPINTYNVTAYVGKFDLINDSYKSISGDTISLSYYVFEENLDKAKKHFKQIHSIINVYETKFGTYPFPRDGYKLVESPYKGMEHQTAIAYGNKYENDLYKKVDYILLHETAHEWWGNSVTAKDFADMWLQEGFATYSEAIFLESVYGPTSALAHIRNWRYNIRNKYPVVGVKNKRHIDFKDHSDVYSKGAWILHTLRDQIDNDSIFFDIIYAFATRNRHKVVTSDDFISIVNEKCNQDYGWFFDYYLNNRNSPTVSYMIDADGYLYYKWANTPEKFHKLKITLESDSESIIIKPSNNVQKIKLPELKGKSKNRFKCNILCYFEVTNYLND